MLLTLGEKSLCSYLTQNLLDTWEDYFKFFNKSKLSYKNNLKFLSKYDFFLIW